MSYTSSDWANHVRRWRYALLGNYCVTKQSSVRLHKCYGFRFFVSKILNVYTINEVRSECITFLSNLHSTFIIRLDRGKAYPQGNACHLYISYFWSISEQALLKEHPKRNMQKGASSFHFTGLIEP